MSDFQLQPHGAWSTKAECVGCEAADAVCAAYRHALKDAARAETLEQAQRAALLAIDTDAYHRLGKTFHLIVKAAYQLYRGEDAALQRLMLACAEIDQHPEATVRGWRGKKV